jgi:putative ABC transport system permease protein
MQGLEIGYSENGLDAYVWSNILWEMMYYQTQIFSLTVILLLVSLPVICIALYLVVYSFGLIRRQKQEQIGILKTRGGSWMQIFTILLGEMVISTVIAVLIGFTVSIFFADLIMRSRDFLSFLGTPVPVVASVSLLQSLFTWGLFLALILNFRRIWQMSRQQITETIIPVEKRPPLWKRYYLDVVMFLVGTGTWLTMQYITQVPIYDMGPAIWMLMFVIALLGIPSPFMMFFGSIMVIARLFPYIMKVLSDFLWRIEGGVNAFAIRNVVRHKQAANRAVLLITLALAFSILSSSLIFSLDETRRIGLYYRSGADIVVPTGSRENNTVLEVLENNISHISDISHIYQAVYTAGEYYTKTYHCLFVDPETYHHVVPQETYYHLSNSLAHLTEIIADNQSIILFEGNMKADITNPSIGDQISLVFENVTKTVSIPLTIGGTFKYWPTFYPRTWYDYSQEYWLIGSIGLLETLNISYSPYTVQSKYILKSSSSSEVADTVEMIYNQTGIQPDSPAVAFQEYKASFQRYFSLSILNSDLIICSTIAIVGVIMFAFFTYVERGKEIGVERALGMTRIQTAQSFLVEALTILSFGTIIGSLTGAFFVTMFLQTTQFGESIPPAIVTYPFSLLGQLLLIILVAAGIGTVIPARMASRKDISRILKVE